MGHGLWRFPVWRLSGCIRDARLHGGPRHCFDVAIVWSTSKILLFSPHKSEMRRALSTCTLRQAFDCAPIERVASKARPASGLFGYSDLQVPQDWAKVVRARRRQADSLVQQIIRDGASRLTVKRLDRLSDMICTVVDTAEVVRHVHPDREMASAANAAHETLSNYLNRLNTHTGLYKVFAGFSYVSSSAKALVAAFNDPEIRKGMSQQEERVAQLLIGDFEQSGIHMPVESRARFVELNDRVLRLGQEFIRNSNIPSTAFVKVKNPFVALEGVSPRIIESISSSGATTAAIPVGHPVSQHILRSCKNEQVRKRLHIALNSGSSRKIKVLEEMLQTRREIAILLGKRSFAQMHLKDKMAKTPGTRTATTYDST